jgi:hypothetical protein
MSMHGQLILSKEVRLESFLLLQCYPSLEESYTINILIEYSHLETGSSGFLSKYVFNDTNDLMMRSESYTEQCISLSYHLKPRRAERVL